MPLLDELETFSPDTPLENFLVFNRAKGAFPIVCINGKPIHRNFSGDFGPNP